MGSTTQVTPLDPPVAPPSSPRMASCGRATSMRARMSSSTSRSAAVTTSTMLDLVAATSTPSRRRRAANRPASRAMVRARSRSSVLMATSLARSAVARRRRAGRRLAVPEFSRELGGSRPGQLDPVLEGLLPPAGDGYRHADGGGHRSVGVVHDAGFGDLLPVRHLLDLVRGELPR